MATETKPKHSPGPWFTDENVRGNPVILAADSTVVCGARSMADGNLIAAAPELLAALEEFVNPVGHDGRCVMRNGGCVLEREWIEARDQRARTLIAKARGEA